MDKWPDLSREVLSDLYPRLLLFAQGRLRRLWWSRSRPEPQEFVQQAILKALSGRRTWANNKTLFENLCQIIAGDINHEVECYDHKHVRNVLSDDGIVNIADYRNPEDTVYHRELERKLLDYLGSHDRVAMDIAALMLNSGITKSHELATLLGLTESDIDNGRKRLRLLVKKFAKENKEELQRITEGDNETIKIEPRRLEED
jgi:DNA-directed RNA polymerase specialized sigma24 family protein